MRLARVALLGLSFVTVHGILSGFCLGQSRETKPVVSDKPLSPDELAVYRSILSGWMNNGSGRHAVSLAIQTMPFHPDSLDPDCGQALHMTEGSVGEVHRFRAEDLPVLRSGKMKANTIRLVDPEAQSKEVAENDPDTHIHKGRSIGEAVDNGFAHGFVSLGEIHFDKDHRYAIVSYDFSCGRLCGNGAMVILEKKNGAWIFHQECSHSVA